MTARKPDGVALGRLNAIIATIAQNPKAAVAEALAFRDAHPGFAPAWRVAALAARRLGEEGRADQFELRAIAVALDHPRLRDAQKALAEERLEDAETTLRAYLREEDPEDPAAALMLGTIAEKCNAMPQAERLYRRALILAPAYAEAALALSKLQRDGGRYEEALATLQAALARDPRHLTALSLSAALFEQLRRLDEADAAFQTLLRHHPGDSRGWMNYGFLLKTIGRTADAIAAYRRSVAIDPANGQAWWGLANMKTVRLGDADIATMRAALADDTLPLEERLHHNFALAKALGDAGDPEGAMAALAAGSRLRLANTPHDPEAVLADVRRSERTFTPAFYAARVQWGCPAPDPIFIVSLPRSGSTLIEQILASHPLIEATEELHDIERIAINIGDATDGSHYTERLEALTREQVRALGERFISLTRRHRRTDRPFFTDKMPGNWMYLGLIRLILPRARIIDVRRHPLGCGLANYMQHFHQGINFSYDLAHIGSFYAAYVRQMAHFGRVFPGKIHRVFHEALVEDFEGEVRRLLDWLELPFDPACLRFFENDRAVHTPSAEQVRQPINRDGMDRWRSYEPWLGPLKEALGAVLEMYPEVPDFRERG